MELSNVIKQVIRVFADEKSYSATGTTTTVSRMISALAQLYEKARNAVEFRAEHLIRRAAIERILKRRVMLGGNAQSHANSLITELLWAKYIDTSFVDEQKEAEIAIIIEKYLLVKKSIGNGNPVSWDMVVGIASAEIDEAIVPAEKREALLFLFYQAVRQKIKIPQVSEEDTNLIAFIAAERAFSQSDDAIIAYHTLKLISTNNDTKQFLDHIATVRNMLSNKYVPPVYRYLRRQVAPYLLLRDFLFETGKEAYAFIEDEKKLEEKLTEIAQHKYSEIGKKVRRAIIRSFLYIFLTKMVFAFALEAPYDLYIAKKLAVLPLVINTLFPPLMLFLVAGLFSLPKEDNTKRLVARIKKILYHFDEMAMEKDTFVARQKIRRPVLTAGFSVVYLITFGITFGLINMALSALQFNVASKIIFVFFVALVSFFAYRIRQSAKEYEIIEHQGVFEPVADFFLMPVLQAGQFLSKEIAKINIFIFLFDFILEAPLKTIFDLVEEWIRFIRLKKEEIV